MKNRIIVSFVAVKVYIIYKEGFRWTVVSCIFVRTSARIRQHADEQRKEQTNLVTLMEIFVCLCMRCLYECVRWLSYGNVREKMSTDGLPEFYISCLIFGLLLSCNPCSFEHMRRLNHQNFAAHTLTAMSFFFVILHRTKSTDAATPVLV